MPLVPAERKPPAATHTHAGPAGRQPLGSAGSATLHGPLPPGLEPFLFIPAREREQHVRRSPSLPAGKLSGGVPFPRGQRHDPTVISEHTPGFRAESTAGLIVCWPFCVSHSRFANPPGQGVRLAFINKVLLAHATPIRCQIICGCFQAPTELNWCDPDWPAMLKMCTFRSFAEITSLWWRGMETRSPQWSGRFVMAPLTTESGQTCLLGCISAK